MAGRAERLLAIERMLYNAGPRGMTVREIAERCSVHRQTIYRDLDTLSGMGVPIYQEKRQYYLDRDRYLIPMRVTLNEAVALFFAARLLSRQADEHNPFVVSALEKLATALPEPIGSHVERTAHLVRERPINREYVRSLEALTRGWSEHRKVSFLYQSAKREEVREHILSPYFLEPSVPSYAAYAIGYDESHQEVRTFKLERMTNAQLLEETFSPPKDFDPLAILKSAWGIMWGEETVEVRLRFSPAVTRRVKESWWHHSQTIEDLPDGGCILTVRIGHPLEIKHWIRGWGPNCEVLTPEDLRQEVAEEAHQLARLYVPPHEL